MSPSTWTMEHPSVAGVVMVGSVVAWSPQFADAINQATGSNRRQAVSDPVVNDAAPGQVDVRSSKVKNNAADFDPATGGGRVTRHSIVLVFPGQKADVGRFPNERSRLGREYRHDPHSCIKPAGKSTFTNASPKRYRNGVQGSSPMRNLPKPSE